MKGEESGRLSRVREGNNGSSIAEVAMWGVQAYQEERAQTRMMVYWLIKMAMIAMCIAAAIVAYEVRGVVEVIKAPRTVRVLSMPPASNTEARPLPAPMSPVREVATEPPNDGALPPLMIDEEYREGRVRERLQFLRSGRASEPTPVRPEGTW